ncbi:MAG: hypothetical protein H6R13_2216 [Proteobacteria bacterium]|nr:hypothetical protein [Pseudomonadota bacterium]
MPCCRWSRRIRFNRSKPPSPAMPQAMTLSLICCQTGGCRPARCRAMTPICSPLRCRDVGCALCCGPDRCVGGFRGGSDWEFREFYGQPEILAKIEIAIPYDNFSFTSWRYFNGRDDTLAAICRASFRTSSCVKGWIPRLMAFSLCCSTKKRMSGADSGASGLPRATAR